MLLLQPDLKQTVKKTAFNPGALSGLGLDSDTYPQPRQMLEQVKYSSGKKELLAMCSSGMSPLKLSLRAWGRGWGRGRGEVSTTTRDQHQPGSSRRYLERLVDDAGGARRASGVVVQLLLQAVQQAAEVRRGVVGPGSPILDGAESLRKQTQLPETLLEETVC